MATLQLYRTLSLTCTEAAAHTMESLGCSLLHQRSAEQFHALVNELETYATHCKVAKDWGNSTPDAPVYLIYCNDIDSVNHGWLLATVWKEPTGFYWES